jgi:hypothetical protein
MDPAIGYALFQVNTALDIYYNLAPTTTISMAREIEPELKSE